MVDVTKRRSRKRVDKCDLCKKPSKTFTQQPWVIKGKIHHTYRVCPECHDKLVQRAREEEALRLCKAPGYCEWDE